MERLTKYGKTSHENGVCCTHFNSKECIEVAGNCSCNCKWEEVAWSKLAAYEDAEEQGLLIRLPCKVGDNLFVLTSDSPTGIEETNCSIIRIDKKSLKIYAPCQYDDWGSGMWCFRNGNFGKNVFLTREEAEKALERVSENA